MRDLVFSIAMRLLVAAICAFALCGIAGMVGSVYAESVQFFLVLWAVFAVICSFYPEPQA